jgi:hypothetical protein
MNEVEHDYEELSDVRLGSSPSQEKSRERRTWDICSISNVTCKNWHENLLLFSTRKNYGKIWLACMVSKSVSPYFSLIFSRLFWPLAYIAIFNPLRDGLEPSLVRRVLSTIAGEGWGLDSLFKRWKRHPHLWVQFVKIMTMQFLFSFISSLRCFKTFCGCFRWYFFFIFLYTGCPPKKSPFRNHSCALSYLWELNWIVDERRKYLQLRLVLH